MINMADCMDSLFLIRRELESHLDWNSVRNENTANIQIIPALLHISSNLYLKKTLNKSPLLEGLFTRELTHTHSHTTTCLLYLSWVWVRLLHCWLIPCLNKDILCHVWPYSFLCLQITRSDIGPHIKWDVRRVIADDHLIFLRGLCGYVLITCMGTLSTLYHLNHFVLIPICSIPSEVHSPRHGVVKRIFDRLIQCTLHHTLITRACFK